MKHKGSQPAASAPDSVDPFVTTDKNLWIKVEHLGRYLFAADYLRGHQPETVADIACGTGYGLPELGTAAGTVIGVDRDQESLDQARERVGGANVELLNICLETGDLVGKLGKRSLQAIVSFETLEHLVDPAKTLAEFASILAPGGTLICSVPNSIYELRTNAGLPSNPFHKQLFSPSSLLVLLRDHGFTPQYRVGQALSNTLFKRETDLLKRRMIFSRIGDVAELHKPERIRELAYLLAYPSPQDVDQSYSIIIVAQKNAVG